MKQRSDYCLAVALAWAFAVLRAACIVAIVVAALTVLFGCRTRLETAGGDTVILTGRADRVTYRSAAGDQFELAGLSHAEETRAAGEMAAQVVKPIARAATWRRLFGALEGVGVAALDRSEAVNANDNALEATKAALETEEAVQLAP